MNPESIFSRWLIANVFDDGDCARIETTTGSGVPDINIQWRAQHFWVETKICHRDTVQLRPYQWAWIKRRTNKGGKVLIIGKQGDSIVYVWPSSTIKADFLGTMMELTNPPYIFPLEKITLKLQLQYLLSETF